MRDDRRFVPLLALALVCAGAAAATVAAKTTGNSSTTTLVATNPHMSVSLPATSTAAPATTTGPQPTVTTGTLPVAPGPPSTAATTTAPPPPPPKPHTPAIRSWPRGHRGYTVVLQSLPESLGRDAAVARAEQARRAGVADVGVLRSGDFSSLRAGYWVVFAGDFGTSEQAQLAAGADRARGLGGAYPAAVAP